jgi:hypothetical protein
MDYLKGKMLIFSRVIRYRKIRKIPPGRVHLSSKETLCSSCNWLLGSNYGAVQGLEAVCQSGFLASYTRGSLGIISFELSRSHVRRARRYAYI